MIAPAVQPPSTVNACAENTEDAALLRDEALLDEAGMLDETAWLELETAKLETTEEMEDALEETPVNRTYTLSSERLPVVFENTNRMPVVFAGSEILFWD